MSPEQKPIIDAILVHSYGYNKPHVLPDQSNAYTTVIDPEESSDTITYQQNEAINVLYRPDKRERWTIRALEELLRTYDIRNVVFTGGHNFGTKAPPLGEVDAQEAKRKLHLQERRINVHVITEKELEGETSPIKDTSGEVIGFLEHAQSNNWKSLASIGTKTHSLSIKQLYAHRNQPVTVFSAEKVLKESENARRYRIIRGMHFSRDEFIFIGRELLKNIIYLFPSGEELLRKKAERER